MDAPNDIKIIIHLAWMGRDRLVNETDLRDGKGRCSGDIHLQYVAFHLVVDSMG